MATCFAKALGGFAAFGIGIGMFGAHAQATAVLVGTSSGTECGGQGGFSNCYAYPDGTTSQGQKGG